MSKTTQRAAQTKLDATAHAGAVLADVLKEVRAAVERAAGMPLPDVPVTLPPSSAMGDVTVPCFSFAALLQKSPPEAATTLASAIQPFGVIASAQAAGPYLNIRLDSAEVAAKTLDAVITQGELYGTSSIARDHLVVIEYISANTNKPLHIGHLRNGLIGSSVAELLAATGSEVVKTDVVNDRGIHIMKSVLAYQKWGNGETPRSAAEKGDHFVGRYYVRFDQAFQEEKQRWLAEQKIDLAHLDERKQEEVEKRFRANSALMAEARDLLQRWEAGDKKVRSLWEQMNRWAMDGWEQTCGLLGFDFDRHYYESEIYAKGKAIIENAANDGVFLRTENGAVIVPLSKHTPLPDKTVLRGDGTSVYMTQDLYLAYKRLDDFGFDRCLYVVGSEQALYFQQLFVALQMLQYPAADRLIHLRYGYVSLPEGKMKSREGTVVDADDLIAEMQRLASAELHKRYQRLAADELARRSRIIALGALKFHFLLVGREADMVFDPKESLSFEGRTGPYLQYTYARASSILRKAGEMPPSVVRYETSEQATWQMVLDLLLFPAVVADAAAQYDPSKLANFLLEAGQHFNTFYHEHPVLTADESERGSRLAVTAAFRAMLGNGLRMLGIETLEEM